MANAPVLKTGVRKDLGVRIPRPPLPYPAISSQSRTMPISFISRREFLATGLGVIPAFAFLPLGRRETCDHAHARRAGTETHPTPRRGITASRVPKAEQLTATPHVVEAFDEVRQIPQIVDGIRCQCPCAGLEGFYSLLTCFEGDAAMAKVCDICRGQGRYAFRLHKSGKTLDEIRAAIDARYG
jgi:hypothetical protein